MSHIYREYWTLVSQSLNYIAQKYLLLIGKIMNIDMLKLTSISEGSVV